MPTDPFAAAGSPPPLAGVCIMQLQRTATDVAYSAAPSGDSNTTDYRLFLEKEGAALHRLTSLSADVRTCRPHEQAHYTSKQQRRRTRALRQASLFCCCCLS